MSTHVDLPHLLPWATFALCWFSLGIIVMLVHALSRPWLLQLEPNQRAALLFRLSLLPVISAAIVTFLNFTPGIGGIVVDSYCPPGEECLRHIPVFCTDLIHAILLTVGPAMLTGIGMWMLYARLHHSISLNRMLSRLADMQPDQPPQASRPPGTGASLGAFKIIETPKLFAYCAGFFRGRLIVSRGLVAALSPSELAAVVAHEQAHSNRYDNARRLLALIGLWLVPQSWSRRLLLDFALASETICDREAARSTGDVQTVVSAVKTIMRLNSPVAESLGAAFIHARNDARLFEDLQRRISELLDDSKKRVPSLFLAAATLITYVYVVAALTEATHHVAEWVLS